MAKTRYKYFKHTADVKFQAYGRTKEEMFSNAALAVFNVMVDTQKVSPAVERTVNVAGDDEYRLLYNFIEELLFILDTEHFLLNKVKEMKIDGKVLHAVLLGDTAIEKYETHGDVKAVTYNDMEITDKYVQVVCDI